MNVNASLNITPILSELFKTQALIRAYVKTVLAEDQKEMFEKNYSKQLKEVIGEFIEDNPDLEITDKDLLLKYLEE